MTIELTAEQERILREALRQGRFRSVDEALNQALRSIAEPAAAAAEDRRCTPAQAAMHIRELRKGNVLPPGVAIRDLIDQGRS